MQRLRSTLLVLALLAQPMPASAATPFSDVASDYFAYEHILNLSERGVIGGFSDGTFRPNANLTRAEAVKVVLGAAGVPMPASIATSFSDVPASHSLHAAVEAAKAKGISSGYPDGTFRPDAPVTRGEAMKLLLNAMDQLQKSPSMEAPYTDVPATNGFAVPIYSARALGIAGGFSDGTFRPNALLTRGQAAKIVYNALLVKEGKRPLEGPATSAHSARELQLVGLINASRAEQGLPALILDPALSAVARAHSQDLHDSFKSFDKEAWATAHPNEVGPWITHDAGDGTSFEKRLPAALSAAGIQNRGATENVGWATFNARTPEAANQIVHEAMMAEVAPDDGHRKNILGQSLNVTLIGVGIVIGENPKEMYATTNFVLR